MMVDVFAGAAIATDGRASCVYLITDAHNGALLRTGVTQCKAVYAELAGIRVAVMALEYLRTVTQATIYTDSCSLAVLLSGHTQPPTGLGRIVLDIRRRMAALKCDVVVRLSCSDALETVRLLAEAATRPDYIPPTPLQYDLLVNRI